MFRCQFVDCVGKGITDSWWSWGGSVLQKKQNIFVLHIYMYTAEIIALRMVYSEFYAQKCWQDVLLSDRAKVRSRALHAASVVHSTSSLILIFALSVGAKGLVCSSSSFFNWIMCEPWGVVECYLELSFNLMGLFVRSWSPYEFPLVVLRWTSILSFHLWCILVDSIWIWIKINLFRFIEGQPNSSEHHLACQNGFDPQWTTIECSLLKIHTTSKHALVTYQTWKVFYAKRSTPDQKSLWIKG